ncbi:hypothetical protein SDC9_209005 [bioreactor metagenome]|uniref:Uncharacterized protein n=1 Tax=bioreactor metagenome TaxID=1076179 RepID=A0A645JDW0_9ZZZZ
MNANGAHKLLDGNCIRGFALDGQAAARVFLMAGHAGNAIIKDYIDGFRAVIGHINQGVDAGMEKGRIAHYRYYAGIHAFSIKYFLRAMP